MITSSAPSVDSTAVEDLLDLADHVAIVTGGGSGIGQGIARRLAQAGAAVVVADLNYDAALATAEVISGDDYLATAVQADVSRVSDARDVTNRAVSMFGRLDILVNNAGIFPPASALDVDESLWDRVLDVNLKGAFFFAQAAAEQMIAQGRGGRIINITSIDALHPTGNLIPYDASKAGMEMMTKSLAKELSSYSITVNAVAPGGINTPGAAMASAAVQQSAGIDLEEMSRTFLGRIPLGRMGDVDDIARTVLFLASRASVYITGSTIVVDGGYLLS